MIIKRKIVENGEEKEVEVELSQQEEVLLNETKSMVLEASKQVATEAIKATEEEMSKKFKEFCEQQASAMKAGAGIYSAEAKKDRKAMNERFRKGITAVLNGDVEAIKTIFQKEMSTDETGTPYAGYTVDSELDAEIRLLQGQYGVARRNMELLTLSKHSYKANELATDLTIAWIGEGSSMLSTQWVTGQNELTLQKLYAIITFTNELLEDTEIDLFRFASERVAEGLAYKEDLAFFSGDGTSTYGSFTGLLNSTTVNSETLTGTTFASLTADDLIDMIDATPIGALGGAKFYMHRSIMSLVRKLKTSTTNDYIYQRPSESGPATIWGYPAELVEAMPTISDSAEDTPFIIFGDLKKGCIFGQKGGLRVERFDAGSIRNVANSADINLITTDRQAVRFIERVGYMQSITGFRIPVTVLSTNTASA
jgi:HK97 family phage major capsid protein